MAVFLITGASTGIGAATARRAKEAGYSLVLAARSEAKLKALTDELGGGDDVLGMPCDVTRLEDQQELFDRAVSAFRQIDVVFANAGIGANTAGTEHGDPEEWKAMLMTNMFGVMVSAKFAIPHIRKTKGHFIITGSVAGRRTLKGSVYGASKWGINAYGYNLREELKGTGCRVTIVEPGLVDTPFFDDPKPEGLRDDDVARTVIFAAEQPQGVELHEIQVLPTPPLEA